jgi:hypothetical protein
MERVHNNHRGNVVSYNPLIHHRRSIRLPGYDYAAPGAYFVTIVARGRLAIFGEIIDGTVRLNTCGEISSAEWMKTATIRREIALDEFIVMPNHFHAIVNIVDCGNGFVGATGRSPLRPETPRGPANKSLASLIAGYKSAVTARINQIRGTPRRPVMATELLGCTGARRCAPTSSAMRMNYPGSANTSAITRWHGKWTTNIPITSNRIIM